MDLSRRRFLLCSLAAVVTGCRPGEAVAPPSSMPGTTSPADAEPPTGTTPPPTGDRPPDGSAVPDAPVETLDPPPDPGLHGSPFTLGVASGDPLPDRVVLWTRLVPDTRADPGGLPHGPMAVLWEVAADRAFGHVVATGTADAGADDAYSVHVDAAGLSPDRWYWYRFRLGRWVSPVGRTRTAPPHASRPERLVMAVASCQNWQAGYYGAYRHLVDDAPDVVVWCGDYIYESGADDGGPRRHDGPEAGSLDAYRSRYAQYRSDPALQDAHAACPWVVTWDDHEVSGDYAGDRPGPAAAETDAEAFLVRRAAAYRAWWEHMPTRLPRPDGPQLMIYRALRWGTLASLLVLDGRQYRSPQPCGPGLATLCPERERSGSTMLGAEQEAWLRQQFAEAAAASTTWAVLVNQTLMTQLTAPTGPGGAPQGNMDAWDGYPAARRRLLDDAVDAGVANLVAVTGDMHASVVGDLQLDGRTVGTEFLGPGISSAFPADRAALFGLTSLVLSQVRLTDGRHRGYLRCEITARQWRTDYRWVRTVERPDSDLAAAAPAYVVRAGTPGAHLA